MDKQQPPVAQAVPAYAGQPMPTAQPVMAQPVMAQPQQPGYAAPQAYAQPAAPQANVYMAQPAIGQVYQQQTTQQTTMVQRQIIGCT